MDQNPLESLDPAFFFAKNVISLLVFPVGLTLGVMLTALVLYFRKPRTSSYIYLTAFATMLLFASSLPLTASVLRTSLDTAAGGYCHPEILREKGVRFIVVLANALVNKDLSPADRWGKSLPRVMEGIRLTLALPETTLVLSGGCKPYMQSDPDAMLELPVKLGVAPERIVIKVGALDTSDEARMFGPMVGDEPFALVTSYYHMPRAVRLFRQRGTAPLSCPCEKPLMAQAPWYTLILPNAASLYETTKALHEYLGMAWAAIIQYRVAKR